MSAEIEFTEGAEPRPGPRCRYCARLLLRKPQAPDETKTHCENPMCDWCFECANGETSVSPWKKQAA
jgi:hypothetical protein